MARTYQGNHPDDGSGWQRAGKCYEDQGDGTDREWIVYTKRQDHSKDWMTVKVACIGSAPKKGNYWFQFNRKTNGVGHSRDYMVLKAHRPDVFDQVLETIRDH